MLDLNIVVVGVDCWDYRPVPYQAIKDRMATKTWKPVDHHRPAGVERHV